MRPAQLYPGDILLFRNFGWLGALISWGEWTGKPKEALEYSHIGLVLDDLQACEMNPPASKKYLLSEVPWDRVDVWRLQTEDGWALVNSPKMVAAFQAEATRRLGERYNFGYIATLAGVGLLARIGLGGFSSWLMNRANPAPDNHRDICSTWAEEILTVAVRTVRPDFDLFPNLGDNRARPSDWPTSPFVQQVLE